MYIYGSTYDNLLLINVNKAYKQRTHLIKNLYFAT